MIISRALSQHILPRNGTKNLVYSHGVFLQCIPQKIVRWRFKLMPTILPILRRLSYAEVFKMSDFIKETTVDMQSPKLMEIILIQS